MQFSIVPLSGIQNRRIDAEYYDPILWNKLEKLHNKTGSLGRLIEPPFRNPMCYGFSYVDEPAIPFIRIDNLISPHIEYESAVYISKETNDTFSSTKLLNNDILMGVRGNTIGRLGVYLGEDGKANFSPNVIRLRPKKSDISAFLSFYLVSEFGQSLIKRETSGTGQPTITADLIEKIQIIKIDQSEQKKFRKYFQLYFNAIEESRELYTQAKHLLESELGLDKLNFQKPVGYTVWFSELEQSRRLDSEHFYPAFRNLVAHLPGHINLVPLGTQLSFCQRGKQPVYSKHGLPVVNSKHVQSNKVVLEGNRTAISNPISELQIRYGDILMNGTGRGTIGRVAPYLVDGQAIPDNHVTMLRSPTLDPAYLSFYLNSLAGQLQVEMHQRGTSGQLELYPFDIREFLVWSAPEELQKEIRSLYGRAAASEQRSKELLDQAKTRVEQLVEKAVGR